MSVFFLFSYISQKKKNMDKKTLIITYILVFLSCSGVYAQNAETPVIKSDYVKVPEGSLYFEEAGTGEPVIFIHGHSLDHRMWDEQFLELAKKYWAIRYDLRGYGISSKQTENFQFTHAEDLIALMDALHIQKVHIVGLPLGGFVDVDMLECPMTKEEVVKRDEENHCTEKSREWM